MQCGALVPIRPSRLQVEGGNGANHLTPYKNEGLQKPFSHPIRVKKLVFARNLLVYSQCRFLPSFGGLLVFSLPYCQYNIKEIGPSHVSSLSFARKGLATHLEGEAA